MNQEIIANLKTQLRPLISADDLNKHTNRRNRSLSLEREDFERKIVTNIVQEIVKWFESILNEKIITNLPSSNQESNEEKKNNDFVSEFLEKLKDGVILCKILQQVSKQSFPQQKYNATPKTPGNMIDNIALFIKGCEDDFAIRVSFNSVDLFEKKNIKHIVSSLHSFGIAANRSNFSPIFQTNFTDIQHITPALIDKLQSPRSPKSTHSSSSSLSTSSTLNCSSQEVKTSNDQNSDDSTDSYIDHNLVDTLLDILQSSDMTENNNNNNISDDVSTKSNDDDDDDGDDDDDYDESNDEDEDDNEIDESTKSLLSLLTDHHHQFTSDDSSSPKDSDHSVDPNNNNANNNNNDDQSQEKIKLRTFTKTTDIATTLEDLLLEINRLKAELKRERKLRISAENKLKKYKEKKKNRSNSSSSSSSPLSRTSPILSRNNSDASSNLLRKGGSAIKLKGAASKLKRISTYSGGVNLSSSNLYEASPEALDEIKELKEKRELIRKQKEDQLKSKLSSKEQRLRLNVLLEILNTEKDYVEDLKIVLRAQNGLLNDKVITITDAQTIFSNIVQILGIHEEMSKAFEERLEASSDEECWNSSIADIILKYSEFFKMYTTYVGNQNAQNQMADQYLHHSKSFISSLLRHCPEFESKQVVLVSFHGCLIKPIQRICKYPLLLRELLRYTEDDHPDKENLDKAFNQLQSITEFINQKKRESENFLKLLEIQETISDLPKNFSVATPERIFIREANLVKISKGRAQERHFYLFNDIILYGAKPMIKSTNRLIFKGKILLQMLLVNDLPDTADRKFTFEIVRLDHKKKKYIICAKDVNEKNEWMNDISALVNGYLAADLQLKNQINEEKGNLQQIREISEQIDDLESVDTSQFDQKALSDHNEKITALQGKLVNLKKVLKTDLASQFLQ